MNITVVGNDKNVVLSCRPDSNDDIIIWDILLNNGTYLSVTFDEMFQPSRLGTV